MTKTITNIAIHSDVLTVIDKLLAHQQFALIQLLSFLPQDALSSDDKIEAQAGSIDVDFANGTFAIHLPGDNDIDFKLGGGDLHLHSAQGTEAREADNADGFTFTFPDGADSPRGKYSFWGIRLKSITLNKTQVIVDLDKCQVIVNHV
jgi:hypothetical protein